MKFDYEGIDASTSVKAKGEIEAVSEFEALRELDKRNIEVFKLEAHTAKRGPKKKVRAADLVLPLQELATLAESGVVLVEAVNALAQNKEHDGLAEGFREITNKIESGESFSSAIAKSKMPFPDYVQFLVKAGEASGQLAQALRNASEQLNYEQTIKNDMRSALTYPVVLVASGIGAMLIIFFAVVPQFSHLLNENKELPTLAWLVLTAGKHANENPLPIFGALLAAIVFLVSVFANKSVRAKLLNSAINLPVVGPWLAEQDAAKWASLCGAMLSARVSLVTALKLSSESIGFDQRRARAQTLVKDVESGESFSKALSRANLLPNTSMNLIAVGDKTGQLDKMMLSVAKLHDEACKRKMKQVMTLIEPIAILIVGVIIGVMIMGVVMAITASTDIAI